MSAEQLKVCAVCTKPLVRPSRCSKCKVVVYCGRECQVQDWPKHKTQCFEGQQQPIGVTPVTHSSKTELRKENFPLQLRNFVYVKSADSVEENLLIMLHGLGDTEQQYVALFKQMKLPQTSCLALRAPTPLPFGVPGFMWLPSFAADGHLLSATTSGRQRTDALTQLDTQFAGLWRTLASHGWQASQLFLLGFSQGGVVATHVGLRCPNELGGIIAISDCLLDESPSISQAPTLRDSPTLTPLLVTHGTKDTVVSTTQMDKKISAVRILYQAQDCRLLRYAKGHDMINSEQETRDIMAFLASRLRLRNLALENSKDVIEVRVNTK